MGIADKLMEVTAGADAARRAMLESNPSASLRTGSERRPDDGAIGQGRLALPEALNRLHCLKKRKNPIPGSASDYADNGLH